MTNMTFANNARLVFNQALLSLRKHSPEILLGAGIVGTVVGTVLACKATTKVSGIMEKTKKDIAQIHQCAENPNLIEEYTEEDKKKYLTIVYVKTGLELAKAYAPAVTVGAVSIASILAGHHIIRQRNVALAAAYTAVDRGFKDYRSRVVDRFGEELDRELRFNVKAEEVEEKVAAENGEEKSVKKTVMTAKTDKHNEYTRCFDVGCNGWSKDAEFNLMFLNHMQIECNKILREQGYLFFNDVLDKLGFPKTSVGQVTGWVYNKKVQNVVDFGIYDLNDPQKRDFVNGLERAIWLDFNVYGNILDYVA